MKKLSQLLFLFCLMNNLKAQVSNFTITNNSATYTLTCIQTSVNLSASTNVIPPVYFVWSGPSFSITAASVTLTQSGNYTVTVLDSLNSVFGTQYFQISSNTVAPNAVVSPNTQTVACNTASGVPVVSNASGNLTHTFISPYGGSVVSNSTPAIYSALGAGTYTHILLDNTNGCSSTATFVQISVSNFPTFDLTSPQNYTLGCSSKSVAIISINNGNTTPAGGPVSYSIAPAFAPGPSISGVLSSLPVYSINTAGVYVVYVRDNTTFCTTQIPVSIISNTVTPNINASVPTQVLDCNTAQVILTGNSLTQNVSYGWAFIGIPGSVNGNSLQVISNAIATTQTLINIYTLTVTDNNNTCKSTSVIPMYQNLFRPNALISSGGNNTLTCVTPIIVLTNQSTTGIPVSTVFPFNMPVVASAWLGPPPQVSLSFTTTYIAAVAGTYTMYAKDLNNGCTASATINITGGCNTVGLQQNSIAGITVKLFPNPGNGVITVISEELLKGATLEIYNSIGVLVKKQILVSDKTMFNLSDYANGIYIVHITQNNELLYTSKLVKE